MSAVAEFRTLLGQCPLVAIIRGVQPDEAVAIGEALHAGGIRIIEVPLNSPDPLTSIGRLARRFEGRALIGAGTVLEVEDVARVRAAGGRLVVSPNMNPAVIAAAAAADMVSAPGFFTPSEAFDAIAAGAHALKLFPAEAAAPAVLKAQRAVLPPDVPVLVVGGVAPGSLAAWLEAGAAGFGLGSGVYKPGMAAAEVTERARAYVGAVAAAGVA